MNRLVAITGALAFLVGILSVLGYQHLAGSPARDLPAARGDAAPSPTGQAPADEGAAPRAVALDWYKAFYLDQDHARAWELKPPHLQSRTTRDRYLQALSYGNPEPRSTPPLRVEDHKLDRDTWVFVIYATNNDERPYLVETRRYDVGWRVERSCVYMEFQAGGVCTVK